MSKIDGKLSARVKGTERQGELDANTRREARENGAANSALCLDRVYIPGVASRDWKRVFARNRDDENVKLLAYGPRLAKAGCLKRLVGLNCTDTLLSSDFPSSGNWKRIRKGQSESHSR